MATKPENRRFFEAGEENVKLTTQLIVDHLAQADEVLIYSEALIPEFYKEVLATSKCRFRIILDRTFGTRVLEVLPKDVQDRITCRFRLSSATLQKHFIVSGNTFRSQLFNDGDELKAISNFNEPKIAQRLRNRFERLWEGSVLCNPHP